MIQPTPSSKLIALVAAKRPLPLLRNTQYMLRSLKQHILTIAKHGSQGVIVQPADGALEASNQRPSWLRALVAAWL
jgi:hypothetical protein